MKSHMMGCVGKAGRELHLLEALGRHGKVTHVTKSKNGHDAPAWHQRLDFLAHCQFQVLLNYGCPRLPKPYLRAVHYKSRYKYLVV